MAVRERATSVSGVLPSVAVSVLVGLAPRGVGARGALSAAGDQGGGGRVDAAVADSVAAGGAGPVVEVCLVPDPPLSEGGGRRGVLFGCESQGGEV